MKIGIMLRAIGERQGIGIYTRNLVEHLLALDSENEYFLYYRDLKFVGRFSQRPNVTEKVLSGPKLYWDQVQVPLQARRDSLDIIIHTKFTVPLFTRIKTVMAVHGAGWFVHPALFKSYSVWYQRCVLPLCCWKANALIANSDLTRDDFITILGIDSRKIKTIYLAADRQFQCLVESERAEAVRSKYSLPDHFILSVIKHDPRKNFANLLEAFRLCREKVPCKLVVVGSGCRRYYKEFRLVGSTFERDIVFLDWLEQEELVYLYQLSSFMFFPSFYETFGIPVCEAIACGRPVVVANTGALPEIAADAGILVNPHRPKEMADALYSLWTDDALRRRFAAKAYARSRYFDWSKTASETLEVLDAVVHGNELSSAGRYSAFGSRLDQFGTSIPEALREAAKNDGQDEGSLDVSSFNSQARWAAKQS